MLPNIPQCTGSSSQGREDLASNVNIAEAEKLGVEHPQACPRTPLLTQPCRLQSRPRSFGCWRSRNLEEQNSLPHCSRSIFFGPYCLFEWIQYSKLVDFIFKNQGLWLVLEYERSVKGLPTRFPQWQRSVGAEEWLPTALYMGYASLTCHLLSFLFTEKHFCAVPQPNMETEGRLIAPTTFTHFHHPRCSWASDHPTSPPKGSCWGKRLSLGPSGIPQARPTHSQDAGRWVDSNCSLFPGLSFFSRQGS